jgi:hypothetical protein
VFHSGFGHTTNQAKGIVNSIDSVEQVQVVKAFALARHAAWSSISRT